MQIRHARRGDEADLAVLLEEHERPLRQSRRPSGAGAPGGGLPDRAAGLAARCAWSQNGTAAWLGFAILNPYFPAPQPDATALFLKELYVAGGRAVGAVSASG